MDMGYWPFLGDTGILFVFFILGYGIFRNFGIWDTGIYFGIQVKLILGYGIYWTVYFGTHWYSDSEYMCIYISDTYTVESPNIARPATLRIWHVNQISNNI